MIAVECLTIGSASWMLPYADLVPALSEDQYNDLRADIAKRGVIVPIIVNDRGEVIDGQHRLRIAVELGLPQNTIPFEVHAGLSSEEERALAKDLNLHRRHLGREERREWVIRLTTQHGLSVRQIAEHTNLPKSTVDRDLTECSGVPFGTPEHVTGSDCKTYPSTKPTAETLNARQERVKEAKAEGQSIREIAKAEGVSVGTVAADLTRPPVVSVLGATRAAEAGSLLNRSEKPVEGRVDFNAFRKDVIREERRAERHEKIERTSQGNAELPTGRTYPIILADPPWRYEFSSDDADQIENHYPTMELEDLRALPVRDLGAETSLLVLWTTSPKLGEALSVLDAWGYTYRTMGVWDKEHIGMGYWLRQQHEPFLFATRGDFPPPAGPLRIPSVHREKKGKHSAKPSFLHEYLERSYPGMGKIELFCRSPREGWDAWGNQSNG